VGQIAELLASGKAEPPLVWFSYEVLSTAGPRFADLLRFGALEVQEHLETFMDRRDAAVEVCHPHFCQYFKAPQIYFFVPRPEQSCCKNMKYWSRLKMSFANCCSLIF